MDEIKRDSSGVPSVGGIPRDPDHFSIVPGSFPRSYNPGFDGVASAQPLSYKGAKAQRRIISSNRAAVTSAIEEMLRRSGLTKAEVARRLNVSRAAISQNSNGSQTRSTGSDGKVRQSWRKPSVAWLCEIAAICGAKVIVEFPDRTETVIRPDAG